MISQYKNIERLRYRISNDIAEASKNTDSVLTRVVEAVVSTVFSYYLSNVSLSFLGNNENNCDGNLHWILTLIISVLFFFLFFVLSYLLIKWIIKKYKQMKFVRTKKDDGIDGKRKATKDFDNIALDSLMLVDEYITLYPDNNIPLTDDPKKKFYLYEIIHYMLTSSQFAIPLVKKSCIVSEGEEKSYYVEDYRFVNYLELFKQQIDFIIEDGKNDKKEGFLEFIKKDNLLKNRFDEIMKNFNTLFEYKSDKDFSNKDT